MAEPEKNDGIVPLSHALDLDGYVPFFLTVIANRWTASSSQDYRREFGLGIGEWRILASIGALGAATSLDVVNLVGMDPGAVSRAMHVLEERELVTPVQGKFAGRNKPYRMTEAGTTIFLAIRGRATAREALLLQDLTPAERAMLLDFLKRMHLRAPELDKTP